MRSLNSANGSNIINCSQSHVSRIIRKYEEQIGNDSHYDIDTTIDKPTVTNQEELLPTQQPRIKLEPDITPIYDRSNYTHDPYGFPISIEDYKIYYPKLYEEDFNCDNNYDEDSESGESGESSESSESSESGESII